MLVGTVGEDVGTDEGLFDGETVGVAVGRML